MSEQLVTLTIDGREVTVPAGTLVVDAARKAGVPIPVFCYHPKMEPVGMCRMCLVEIGRPVRDRQTGEFLRNEDGSLQIQFGPKLETACTVPVSEGMVVRTQSELVLEARRGVLEFLLTSHPLDCPICDKGGECPLQNLTMAWGPGESRFRYEDKFHLEKRVPLGDFIVLDRERCIQCARCIRFQSEIADDPVLGFYHRGRHTDIVTFSDPPFDSYWSGNTTDICPVGALTTVDFRFGARPWEMRPAASICTLCPVGCNITFNVRREAASGGRFVIKRVMPRQNEQVNEIWICDKGRFAAYHFAEAEERLTQPLIRRNGELTPATWEEALALVAERFGISWGGLLTLVSGRLPNEDLYILARLTEGLGGQTALYTHLGGGEWVARYGLGPGSNLGDLGVGDAVLVVASDLEEEAPLWWLRVKEAARRGATLVVANPRPIKLERAATHVLRYAYGEEVATVQALAQGEGEAAQALAQARRLVVFYGQEGLDLAASEALAAACARLLSATGHAGQEGSGLVAVWPRPNDQGAWELGFRPVADLAGALRQAQAVYIAGADPAGDDPALAEALEAVPFVVVQELFLTETARRADVVFPVVAYTEREGTLVNGERRVQRFYPAVPAPEGTQPDYAIAAAIGERLGLALTVGYPSAIFAHLAQEVPAFAGLTYPLLAEVSEQWPLIGRADLYYGGTAYENRQGLGKLLPNALQRGEAVAAPEIPAAPGLPAGEGLLAVPVTRLYDRGTLVLPATLRKRLPETAFVWLAPATAERLGLAEGQRVALHGANLLGEAEVRLRPEVPEDVVLVPRSLGLAVTRPIRVRLQRLEPAVA